MSRVRQFILEKDKEEVIVQYGDKIVFRCPAPLRFSNETICKIQFSFLNGSGQVGFGAGGEFE